MPKHLLTTSPTPPPSLKRPRTAPHRFSPIKVASFDAAAAVDHDLPLSKLLKAVEQSVENPARGECIMYWMRMGDLRGKALTAYFSNRFNMPSVSDNRALSMASKQATKDGIPLVVIFALSPQDYIAHDRSARRIDFTLRNLTKVKASLS